LNCGMPSDPDLLRESARRERVSADCFHRRRSRRHGVGRGRIACRPDGWRGREPVGDLSRGIAGPNRHFRHLHSCPAASSERAVWSRGVKPLAFVPFAVAPLAMVPVATTSNVVLNFLIAVLLIALVGQGWNVLGGYG